MSKSGFRIKKSRSMMVSLYTLCGVALLIVATFMVTLMLHIAVHLGQADWSRLFDVFQHSFLSLSVAIVLALPFATAITSLSVLGASSRFAAPLSTLHRFLGQAPYLIYGLVFLILLGGGDWSSILALSFLSVTQLSRRWIGVSAQVQMIEVETMQSLGLNVFGLFVKLYLKRFFVAYLSHLFSVFFSLFVVVTPLICLQRAAEQVPSLVSIELFKSLGENSDQSASFAFVLLLVHGLKVILDYRTSFWEVEFG